jgi:hypothetical protein
VGKGESITIGKRNIPPIQNHHWLKLGASNSIYSNQICRKKIVRGVKNRFDKQISSIIRREYRSQENLSLFRREAFLWRAIETLGLSIYFT